MREWIGYNALIMDALILFSHGSLLCGSGEALNEHAGRLRRTNEWPMVEVGYMNYSEPAFETTVTKCVEAGATRIIVVPFFLVPGYFVTKSLPEHLGVVQDRYPKIEFVVSNAIGFDAALADALIESAQSPLGPEQWRDGLTSAARNCRANSECPLYATPNCPRVPAPNTPVRPFVE